MEKYEGVRVPWPGWKVIKGLGEGGYGKVYKIERTQHGITDTDALKIIRIPKSNREYEEIAYRMTSEDSEAINALLTEQKDNLIEEIRAMQKLKANDNIVSIKDWAVEKLEDGYSWEIYIRMDVLTPLKKYIKDKDFNESDVIRLGEDICNALVQCEEENIVHRDIKPDNIMVSENGKYMLTDFGIVKYLADETTMTGIGSKEYMAPEVANYEKSNHTVDIYSLGLVMYELLNNNKQPFLDVSGKYSGLEKQAAIQRRLKGEKLPAPAYGSEELKQIVLKAAAPDKSKRYQFAQDMLSELEKLEHGKNEKNDQEIKEKNDEDMNVADSSAMSTSFDWGQVIDDYKGAESREENRIDVLLRAAEQGDAVAQYNLGNCYLYGEGVEQNYEEAVKWYRLAAEQGDAFAQNKLGVCYEKGTGVEQNYEEAAKWYALAAEQEYVNAQDNLERCYAKMEEVAYDSQEIDEQELTLNEEEEIDALKRRLKELTDNDINLKKIEKDIVEEDTLDEKIDKYYSLYKENEEFQKLLDTEYADLKENNADDEITYGNQIIEGQEFTAHEEEEIEALKMRLKELTDNNINLNVIENAIVEDAPIDEKIEKADSPAEGKKKERKIIIAFFAILFTIAIATIVFNLTKPENDPELREAYENFKAVATENGWDVGKLSSTKKGTYAYAKAHKLLNAEDAWSLITIELYKNEKDYAAEIKSYKAVAEIRGNPNVYTETANIYGQNITAFKDRTIYKANVKSDEGREEVYNLLEALGIETSSETPETTEDTPVKEQYNLEDYLGIYSNGQAGVEIIKDYSDEASESSVLILVGWAWDGKVSRDWKMYGTFDSETASINYNKSDLREYFDSNNSGSKYSDLKEYFDSHNSESKYTDDYGSGRFICNEDGSIKWEDDNDGIGNGETFTRCEPHMDKDFVGVWKKKEGGYRINADGSHTPFETYCTLNEDGNYSYYRDDYLKKEENGKWAVVEVPYGDDTLVYVVLYNDARPAPDYDNSQDLFYIEQEDCLIYSEEIILYRSDE